MEKTIANLESILDNIAAVCARIGRNPEEIEIIAASKYQKLDTLKSLYADGRIKIFGENRVQEMMEKYDPSLTWDFIGQLQTNKVKYIVGKTRLIHSVDRLPLAEEINARAARAGIVQDALIEINSGNEENKGGVEVDACRALYESIRALPNIRIKGLMAVAPKVSESVSLRACFMPVKRLFDEMREEFPDFQILSMGMSDDYLLAVECGSNLVRLGRVLFN